MVGERPFLMQFIFTCQHDCPGEATAASNDNEALIACQDERHSASLAMDASSCADSFLEYLQEELHGCYTVCLRDLS